MFLCSAILFFGESPAGYDVYREENSFIFKRHVAVEDGNIPARIYIEKKENGWLITAPLPEDVREQIAQIIELNEVIDLQIDLSAAS